MDKEQALFDLKTLDGGDFEWTHEQADKILLEYLRDNGDADIAAAWEALDDACGGFCYTY